MTPEKLTSSHSSDSPRQIRNACARCPTASSPREARYTLSVQAQRSLKILSI